MTRKQLPKAITPRSAALVQTVVSGVAADDASPAKQAIALDAREPEPMLAMSSVTPANGTFAAMPIRFQQLAARRRVLARKVVERHGTYAAVSGLAPVPIVNIAGVAAIIVRMVKQLSVLYQIPFERDRTRSFVIGILGGAVPTGLGAATSSTLGFIAPSVAFLGLAASALSAGALTRAIGLVFMESFERECLPDGGVAELNYA
jgi:uncharacterized protein (DUF697 family)